MPVTAPSFTSLRCRDCTPRVGIHQRHDDTMPHTYLPNTKHSAAQRKTTTTEHAYRLQYDHIYTTTHRSRTDTHSADLTSLNTQEIIRIYTTINPQNNIDSHMKREETESRQPAITWLTAGTAEYAIPQTFSACSLRHR